MNQLKKISPSDLVCMNDAQHQNLYRIELAYAQNNNLLFGERIYRKDARLYLHNSLAQIVIRAAQNCQKKYGLRFVLYDGLRTTDAQALMMETQRVKENPHWLEEPRLLSPPGTGGHPRAMAIDIGLETPDGQIIDMGTPFDFLAENADSAHNPAHREYKKHSDVITQNRQKLDDCMQESADYFNTPLVLLPQEWWDFRLPSEIYSQYRPLSEADLPPAMRLI